MEIYLVGGAVRDDILGIPNTEKDWVVVGATPEDMLSQGFIPVGKHFPVFIHPDSGEEYALARTERKVSPGYHGFEFNAAPDVTLAEDLKRRDLTINAMARDSAGNLIDPWDGIKDIKQKKLRHTSSAFVEDPVRILRTARFYATFHHLGFILHNETLELLKQMVANGEADHLVAERVWLEAYKALQSKNPAIFFKVLQCVNLLDKTFPELSFVAQDNVFAHCLDQHSTQHPPQILFALLSYMAALNKLSLKPLCQRLKLSHTYTNIATLGERIGQYLTKPHKYSAEELLDIIQAGDGLRKTQIFKDFIQSTLLYDESIKGNVQQLTTAIAVLKSLNFKNLIGDEATGNVIPQRVRAIRLEALKNI